MSDRPGSKVRVVVVDDEADIRIVVRAILRRSNGFEVVGEAADGSVAIDVVEQERPDVVLLDLMMPTSGEEALPHLLKVHPSCMVAVFSASEADQHRERLLSLGAFTYYEKSQMQSLADLLEADYARFGRAMNGEETVPSWVGKSPT